VTEHEPEPQPDEVEDLPEFDFADPLKREDDDELPGLDPAITIPPEE
jgi:hypothetical protein